MTEECIKKLHEFHKEELADQEKYSHFANELEDYGMLREAGIVRDIAHEERTHAQLMAHILEKEGSA